MTHGPSPTASELSVRRARFGPMRAEVHALIIGGGPAGASAAIGMARAGWRVTLIEQFRFPRHKVCGECIAAASWTLLDELGVGSQLRQLAGPELRQVGWISTQCTLDAQMPACPLGPYPYGRAVDRSYLDTILLEKARSIGVAVIQPATLLEVSGHWGQFECRYESRSPSGGPALRSRTASTLRAPLVIDARGSCPRRPLFSRESKSRTRRAVRSGSAADLLAFKCNFRDTTLADGYLPVIAFNGGYGGMVIGHDGLATLACVIRRDVLARYRRDAPGEAAGDVIEANLRRTCPPVGEVLKDAKRERGWLSMGPIQPGVHIQPDDRTLRIGNAAGETHPLIGEGIGMALKSAALLVEQLGRDPAIAHDPRELHRARTRYASKWLREFAPRLAVSKLYANVAMRSKLASAAQAMFSQCPQTLTFAARLAGKARPAALSRAGVI